MKKIISLLVLVISIGIFAGCQTASAKESSYVAIDINPSVELVLDENDNVLYANSLNADGEVLLASLNLVGKNVDEAMDLVIQEATELGFIDPEKETTVSVTTLNDEEVKQEDLEKKAKEAVEKAFVNRGMKGIAKMNQMTQELIDEATTLGISAGKLRLIKQAQALDPALTLEVAMEMKVSELVHLVKENGNQTKDMSQALKAEFFQAREAIRAEYTTQIEDLNTQIEAKSAQIEASVDETEKANLQTELDQLNADLEAIYQEISTRVKELRNTYKDEINAIKETRIQERAARIEEHKAKVKEFVDQFRKNLNKQKEAVKQWQEQQENN